MKKLWKEFVAFIMTGNVLMLAVAFVMGGLTKKVIDDFVAYIINPLIGAIVGKPDFSNTLKLGKGLIQYGAFIGEQRAGRRRSRSAAAHRGDRRDRSYRDQR